MSGEAALFVPIDNAGGQTIQYVFVTGGTTSDSVPGSFANAATIQSDGSLGSWTTLNAPPARAFHAMVAATPFNSKVKGSGYLYVLGGITTKNGDPVVNIDMASLQNDGTAGTFNAATMTLPKGLHSFGAVVFRSAIYIVGGATTGNQPVTTVYRSRIDSLGQLSPWDSLTSLPSPVAYAGLNQFGGHLYLVGGDTAAVDPNDPNYTQNGSKRAEVLYS